MKLTKQGVRDLNGPAADGGAFNGKRRNVEDVTWGRRGSPEHQFEPVLDMGATIVGWRCWKCRRWSDRAMKFCDF